ncbi:MAG: hypothetical protein ACOCV4_08095 [Myxococcota bacterium]
MRTDRTTLCAHCAVRFPSADRCPRCGGTDLFDLTRPRARRRALQAVRRPRPLREPRRWSQRIVSLYLRYGIVLLTAIGALLGWRLGGTWTSSFIFGLAAFWVALALFFIGGAVLYVLGSMGRLASGALRAGARWASPAARRDRRRILTIDDQELLASPGVHELRGRVRRTGTTLRSPLGQVDCVGWRLVGSGPVGDVDDARAVAFDVVGEDGSVVRVEPSPATLAVEVDAPPSEIELSAALADFLAERGVYPDRGPVRLAEALLEDGARVVVEGSLEARAGPDGSQPASVMREHPGAPLVIRRV